MSDKFYAIERFVVPHDGVILKITPRSTREDAQLIIDNSEAPTTAISNFGGNNKKQ